MLNIFKKNRTQIFEKKEHLLCLCKMKRWLVNSHIRESKVVFYSFYTSRKIYFFSKICVKKKMY
jgi:hypothetical protein